MDRTILQKIGKYQVVKELGRGATSTVYLAADAFGNREVAVKLIDAEALKDPRSGKFYRKQLTTEAALAGKLIHPHITAIYDAVLEEDSAYIVMEYVGGGTLERFTLVENLLRINRVVEIGFKCCRALEFAQRHGIIHRDIKPANILLTPTGDIKISDFGSALMPRADSTQVTGIGSRAMSPEQVQSSSLLTRATSTPRWCCTSFTGRLPFNASNQASMIYQIINIDPPRSWTCGRNCPRNWSGSCRRPCRSSWRPATPTGTSSLRICPPSATLTTPSARFPTPRNSAP